MAAAGDLCKEGMTGGVGEWGSGGRDDSNISEFPLCDSIVF